MARAVVKVTSLTLVCCGVAVACSTSPSASIGTPGAPATPAKPDAPAPTPFLYFQGTLNVAKQSIRMTYTTPRGQVFHQVLKAQSTLPYGPGANEVYLDTVESSVIFDVSNTPGCNGTPGDPHLCALVNVQNHYSATVSGVSAVFTSVVPSTVSVVGQPYLYGDVPGESSSANVEWIFDDGPSVNFTFAGYMAGTPPTSNDAGADSGTSSGMDAGTDAGCNTDLQCTDGEHCDPEDGTCYPCVSDGQCPAGQACENFSCINCILNNECTVQTEATECCGGTPYCDGANCEECLVDANCHNSARPYCNQEVFVCVQCITNSQCTSGQICDGGLCVTG